MKVLFLTFHLPSPSEAGAARPWEELQLMRELGCDVTVVTASAHYLTGDIRLRPRGLWRRDAESGAVVIRTRSPAHYRSSQLRRIWCYVSYSALAFFAGLSTRPADAVLAATDPPFATITAYALSVLLRAKLVLDERDVFPDTAEALGMSPSPIVTTATARWSRWLRERSFAVVTVSPGLERLIRKRGAPENRTFVIPNYFPSEHSGARSKPDLQEERDHFIALYAGSLGFAPHVGCILDAASILQAREPRIEFLILGSGERRKEYQERSKRDRMGNVRFADMVPRSETQQVLNTANVALHSLPRHPFWRNSFSSKVLEYMASGVPVVFAGEGDIADVLRESGAGVVVPPEDGAAMADALISLYRNPTLRSSMGVAGQDYVRKHFSRAVSRATLAQALGEA